MRDRGIVKHKILLFTIPHPLPRELPLRKGAFLFPSLCISSFLRQAFLSCDFHLGEIGGIGRIGAFLGLEIALEAKRDGVLHHAVIFKGRDAA